VPAGNYAELKVRLDRELYMRLLLYAVSKYGRARGSLSRVVEEAIREYLERHAQA